MKEFKVEEDLSNDNNMDLIMRCSAICTEVNGKSTSPAFKDIEVNDIINFSTILKKAGRRGNGFTYATYIKCRNLRTGEVSNLSFNQLPNVMKNFEFKEWEV